MLVLERQNVVILKPHKPSPLHRPLTQVSFKDSNRRRKNKQGGNVGVWDDRRGARGRLRAHRVFRTLPINLGSYLGRFCSFFLSPNIFFWGEGLFRCVSVYTYDGVVDVRQIVSRECLRNKCAFKRSPVENPEIWHDWLRAKSNTSHGGRQMTLRHVRYVPLPYRRQGKVSFSEWDVINAND